MTEKQTPRLWPRGNESLHDARLRVAAEAVIAEAKPTDFQSPTVLERLTESPRAILASGAALVSAVVIATPNAVNLRPIENYFQGVGQEMGQLFRAGVPDQPKNPRGPGERDTHNVHPTGLKQ